MFKKKKIWFNLHLLISCIFALPILVLAITGSILSYANEIEIFFNEKYSKVIFEDKRILQVDELLLKFSEQKPNLNVVDIDVFSHKGAPPRIKAGPKNIRYSNWEYILNPYSGEIITKNYASYTMLAILRVHVWLGIHFDNWMPYGNQITGLSTFAFLFILISGIYLYYPNMKRKFLNSFKINIQNKGYKFLYNLHTALGVWLSIFFLIMCFTGVYMSYHFVQNMIDPIFGLEKVKGPGKFSIVPKPIGSSAVTNSNKVKEIATAFELAKKAINDDYSQISIDVENLNEKTYMYMFSYYDKKETYKIWSNKKYVAINMKRKRVMQTEEKVTVDGFNKRKMNKIVLELHEGKFFGPIGTFVWFITCILFVVFPITGFMMTLRRLRRKKAT